MSLVSGFLLFGFMLLTAVRAEAQSANWVTPDEAKTRLFTKVSQQHDIISSNQVGTPDYNDAMMRATYYKEVYRIINDGVTVSEAVQSGLSAVTTGTDANSIPVQDGSTPQSPLQYLIDEATLLLTN